MVGWWVSRGQSLNSNPCRPLTLGLIDKLWQIGHGVSLLCASAESIHTGVRLLDPPLRDRQLGPPDTRYVREQITAPLVGGGGLCDCRLFTTPDSQAVSSRKTWVIDKLDSWRCRWLWRSLFRRVHLGGRLGGFGGWVTGRVVDRFRLVQVRAGR